MGPTDAEYQSTMEASEGRRLKELEDENRRLKHMVADLSLDKEAHKGGDSKKRLELVGLRQDVALVMTEYHYSGRRACSPLRRFISAVSSLDSSEFRVKF
jgi:hypothetical protein